MGMKLAGIMFILMLAMTGLGYWYYNNTQDKMAVLVENAAKLEVAMQTQKQAIESYKADIQQVTAEKSAVEAEFTTSRNAVEDLTNKFNKVSNLLGARDIGKTGAAKPNVIARIITKGSNNMMRCFEILSGDPLTEKEKNAEKKSQINSMCPDVANPSYIPTP